MLGREEQVHILALMRTEGVGAITARHLLAYCGSAIQVFKKTPAFLAKIPGIGDKTAHLITQSASYITEAEKILAQQDTLGIQTIDYLSPEYPEFLKEIDSYPLLLFCKGKVDFHQTCISIVGTRTPSKYGQRVAAELAECLSANHCVVVSGLAAGIDGSAHLGALKGGTETVAVLAHGLNHIYPAAHTHLAEKITQQGALISEYPIHVMPDPRMFPHRNRIIAGLSRATIVVEAKATGGALITAHLAFDYNREVFAVPGLMSEATSAGCHQLIRKNIAKILTQPEDILEDLQLQLERRKSIPQPELFLSEPEQQLVQAIQKGIIELEPLSYHTSMPMNQILALLLTLEFKGIIQQVPGNKYVIPS